MYRARPSRGLKWGPGPSKGHLDLMIQFYSRMVAKNAYSIHFLYTLHNML